MTLIPYAGAESRKPRAKKPVKPKQPRPRAARPPADPNKPKARRGFAAMSPELQRELSARGGAALKPEQRTYYRNRALAAECAARSVAKRKEQGATCPAQ